MAYIATENDVNSVVRDFTSLCDYIERNNPSATPKGNLSLKACYEINQLMSRPDKGVTPKTQMNKYASIVLWFNVAMESRLIGYSDRSKGKVVFEVTEKYVPFTNMNIFSQYLFIFYAWLHFVDCEQLYGGMGLGKMSLPEIDTIFDELIDVGTMEWYTLNDKQHDLFGSSLKFIMNLNCKFIINLMDLGLLICEKGPSAYTYIDYPVIKRLKPTAFGIQMMKSCKTRRHSWFNKHVGVCVGIKEQKEYKRTMKALEKGKETFHDPFISMFPKDSIDQDTIGKILCEYEKEDNRVFDFKVSLDKDFYFIIRCSLAHSFEELHLEIQKALKFDNDHLYSFYLDGKKYSKNAVNAPYSDQPPYTVDTLLGDVRLYNNQRILYLFDYGDSWQFNITVKTTTETVAKKKLELIKIYGEPPKQYPDYDW